MMLGNIAAVAILFTTEMAWAQQGPAAQQETPQSQPPAAHPVQPIEGGRHLQPQGRQLQDFGVPPPSRGEVREMDRLMQQLLESSANGQDNATRP